MNDDEIAETRRLLMPKLVRLVVIQSVAIVVLLIGMVVLGYMAAKKQPLTFAVTATGSVIPLVPMNEPYLNDSRVIGFADECVRQAFSHDFKNFRQTVTAAKGCFTNTGSRGFDLQISPLIDDIQKRRMVMSVSLEPSVVMRKQEVGGVHTWVVQTRMTLYREGTKERVIPATYTVDLVIERVRLEESVRGVGIAQINVKPSSST